MRIVPQDACVCVHVCACKFPCDLVAYVLYAPSSMMLTSKDHKDSFYLASAGLAVEELLPHVCVCALYLSEVIKAVEWRELRLLGIGAKNHKTWG